MKKFLFLIVSFIVLENLRAQSDNSPAIPDGQVVYTLWDFQGGALPNGFKLFDLDGMDYHYWVLRMGFDKDNPWIWAIEKEGSNNACVASISYYYEETKPGNDWMVTPGIYVSPKEGRLTWKSRSDMETQGILANLKGGYSVYISTNGQNPEDFTEEPVFSVDAEDLDWQEHFVDVSGYYGQTIYVAFANQTTHTGLVLLDDITLIGEKRPAEMELLTDRYVFANQQVAVKCRFTATTDVPVTSLKAYYSIGENTYTKDVSGINLKKGEFYTVEFDEKIPVSVSDTVSYKVWADVAGYDYNAIDKDIICLSFKPERKVVIEEGTGMWCGACPLGIVAFDRLSEKYPDNFIGIAVHYGDAITDETYIDKLGFEVYPSGTVNRQVRNSQPMVVQYEKDKAYYTTLAGGFETYLLEELNDEVAAASMTLTAGFKDEEKKTVGAKVDYRFAKSYADADMRFAFVLLENGVTGPGFYQNNSYSGFNGDCGGFESMPGKIAGYTFHHVARGIFDSFEGIAESIPTRINADTPMSFEYNLTLPTPKTGPAIIPDNLELVAMLINSATGEILNADKVALGDGNNIFSRSEDKGVSYSVSNGFCHVILPGDINGMIKVGLIDMSGRTISVVNTEASAGKEIKLAAQGYKGVCLLKVTNGDMTSVHKILIE